MGCIEQLAHNIEVDFSEALRGNRDLLENGNGVHGYLGDLTGDALLAPPCDVGLHPLPDPPPCD